MQHFSVIRVFEQLKFLEKKKVNLPPGKGGTPSGGDSAIGREGIAADVIHEPKKHIYSRKKED